MGVIRARPPRARRPDPPPPRTVAVAALAVLASKNPHPDSPEGVLLRYVRAHAGPDNEIREVEAVRLVEQKLAEGVGVERALGIAGRRFNVHPQTVRRWRDRSRPGSA
ncbi:MAG: hypothetical protein QM704_14870 [Anaeromyxobacteraceae bacterium]